jgi:hypothetical protein
VLIYKVHYMKRIFAVLILVLSSLISSAQDWILNHKSQNKLIYNCHINFIKYFELDSFNLSIPNPHGEIEIYHFKQNNLIPHALKEKFSNLRTYDGFYNINNSIKYAKMSIFDNTIDVYVFDDEKTYLIQKNQNDAYEIYYKRDIETTPTFKCLNAYTTLNNNDYGEAVIINTIQTRDILKKYRLALSCTYQYAVAVSNTTTPTKAQVFAAMTTTINRVNGIYERELGITFEFIPNNDTLIFITNSNSTFTNNNPSAMLTQNRNFINSRIGSNNYDIGHVFSTQGGGLAMLASICRNSKAEGVTGMQFPYNDPFDVDYVSHEMGHQLGANHTFNRCDLSNENRTSAYEPGGGSTIMAYAGICQDQNIQNNSDDYFHLYSKKEIFSHLSSNNVASCGTILNSNISINDFSIFTAYNIPANTPFELIAPHEVVADKYNWYQWNLGNFTNMEHNSINYIAGPNLRSYPPTNNGTRAFPIIDSILVGNHNFIGERLSAVTRNLYFKLDAIKINNGWGASKSSNDTFVVYTHSNAKGFSVTNPNEKNISWKKNAITNIQWEVSNSNTAPINCDRVDIFLSHDGGYNFNDTIAMQVLNTGSYQYLVPNNLNSGNNYRIKIKCSSNIFFDINNYNFTIDTVSATNISFINKEDILIYPNPSRGTLNIEGNFENNTELILFDILGRKLNVFELKSKHNIIDVGELQKGNYVVIINNDKQEKIFHQIIIIE